MVKKKCVICGKAFMPKHGSQLCCSDECKKTRHRQSSMAWQREHKKPRKEFEFVCATCGGKFVSNKPNRKTCSAECRKKYLKKAQKEADERHQQKQKEMLEKQKNKPKSKNLAEFNEEARAMGMTYGQYDTYLRMKGSENGSK